MNMTKPETHKAQKAHRCDWCWERIEQAAQYKRYRFYNDGEAATVRLHPECYGVMLDEAAQEGGWLEWTPGQERPEPTNLEQPCHQE